MITSDEILEKVVNGDKSVWVEKRFGNIEETPKVVWCWDSDGYLLRVTLKKGKNGPYIDEIQNVVDINKNKIELFEGESGEKLVKDEENQEVLKIDDFIKKRGIKSGELISGIKRMFQNLELKGRAYGLEIINNGDYLKIPEKRYTKNKFEKWLEMNFKFDVNEEIAKKEIQKLWDILTPQQRMDLIAAVGIPLHNMILDVFNLNLEKIYALSYGETESGKTFVYQVAEKFFWGIQKFLKGSAFESSFRIDLALSSTNLPLLIDDAEPIKEKVAVIVKAGTSGGAGFRGTASQDVNIYPPRATLFMTSQYNMFENLFLTDRKAMERRFYINFYNAKIKDKKEGQKFLLAIQTSGWIFEYLKKISAEELKKLLQDLYEKSDNGVENALKLGVEVMKKLEVDLDKEAYQEIGEMGELEIYEEILQDAERMKKGEESGGMDSEARRLSTLIDVREMDGIDVVLVTQGYLDLQNQRGLLKGKVKKLNELNKLEILFDREILNKLPNKTIYCRENVFRIKEKTYRCAIIPIIEETERRAIAYNIKRLLDLLPNVTNNNIYGNINYSRNVTMLPLLPYYNDIFNQNLSEQNFCEIICITQKSGNMVTYDEKSVTTAGNVVTYDVKFGNPLDNIIGNISESSVTKEKEENLNKNIQTKVNISNSIEMKNEPTTLPPTQPQPTSPQPPQQPQQPQEPTQQPLTTQPQSTSPQPHQQNQIPQPSSTQPQPQIQQPQTLKIEFLKDIPKIVFNKKEFGPCKKGDVIEIEKDLADLFIKKGFAMEFQELTKEIALAIKNALMMMSEFGKDQETFNKVKDFCKNNYNLQIKEEWIIKVINKLEENGNIFIYPPTGKFRWIRFGEGGEVDI